MHPEDLESAETGEAGRTKPSKAHRGRKALFKLGLARGWLSIDEIERAIPLDATSAAERWLLYYSLRAAQIEIRE